MPLVVVATPIGNLGDLSPRAAEALTRADMWLVEDTRVSGKLQAHLGIRRPMQVLNDHTPPKRIEEYAQFAAESSVALLTDAGTPGISDPGAELVSLCAEREVEIDAVPGPSAVTTALSLSGFYAQRFAFLGFLPRKPGPAKKLLEPYVDSTLTLVLFESPHRFLATLELLADVLGSRRYAICRELTKSHQQVIRGNLSELQGQGQVTQKGEITLVVEGRRKRESKGDRNV